MDRNPFQTTYMNTDQEYRSGEMFTSSFNGGTDKTINIMSNGEKNHCLIITTKPGVSLVFYRPPLGLKLFQSPHTTTPNLFKPYLSQILLPDPLHAGSKLFDIVAKLVTSNHEPSRD